MRPDAPPLSTAQDEGSGGHELRRCRRPALAENGSRRVVPLQNAKEHPHLSALTAGSTPMHEFLQPDDCHNLYVQAALSSEKPMRRNTAAKKKAGKQTRPRERISRCLHRPPEQPPIP